MSSVFRALWSFERMTLPVYPAVSLSRPSPGHASTAPAMIALGFWGLSKVESIQGGGQRSRQLDWTTHSLGRPRQDPEGSGSLQLDLKGVVRVLAGCLGLGRASCLHPAPPGTPACSLELA